MRTFPIQLDDRITSIPWDLIAPHEAQARTNHSGWSLERLAARGGVMTEEALAIIEDRPWARMPCSEATKRLQAYADGAADNMQVRALVAVLDDITPDPAYIQGTPVTAPSDAILRLEHAIDLAHRLRANTPVKHTANELIATLEGVRIMLQGETV